MALSSQWLVRWVPPAAVVADIGRQFDRSAAHFSRYHDLHQPYYHHQHQEYDYRPREYDSWHHEYDSRQREYDSRQREYDSRQREYDSRQREYDYRQHDYDSRQREYDSRPKPNPSDGGAGVAGVTLWLAVLGLARPQTLAADSETPPFSTLYKWKTMDFEFPSLAHRSQALAQGRFVPSSVLPLGLEVWGERVFVTLPSWRRGVPATLATVPRAGGLRSPPLRPYPDWTYHRAFNDDKNCSGLISVFRVSADSCGRLWVLDSGQVDSSDDPKQVCPPSVVLFDLVTDAFIARYPIPSEFVLQDSLFSNIIADTRTADCSDLHLYIADTWRFGLLVFRHADEKFWRFSHHLFFPDPLASNFSLHGVNFQWTDGIFGLALSPLNEHLERTLYFHSLSSYREFSVSTRVLQQPSRVNDSATEFSIVGDSRGKLGQASASAIDRRGVMFYGLVSRDSVGCWDTRKPYHKTTTGVVAANSETLIFPNDIKVDQEERQSVWVISNRLPMFQDAPLDETDYNYRILFADSAEAVRGSVCDPLQKLSPSIMFNQLP